jgi:hypothetical protein
VVAIVVIVSRPARDGLALARGFVVVVIVSRPAGDGLVLARSFLIVIVSRSPRGSRAVIVFKTLRLGFRWSALRFIFVWQESEAAFGALDPLPRIRCFEELELGCAGRAFERNCHGDQLGIGEGLRLADYYL